MKTIIIYTTKYGSVKKATEILSSKLSGEVLQKNLSKEKVPDLKEFDNVILGGSIYIGKMQKTLTKYINASLPVLLQKKIGLFICAGEPDLAVRTRELENSFPPELFNHAAAREVFGHEFNYEKLNFLDKFIMRTFKGVTESSFDLSEEKIENFANAINQMH